MIVKLRNERRASVLMVTLGVAFATMLVASIFQRFAHPDLTITRFTNMERSEQKEQATAQETESMGAIGKLMREVAQNPQNGEALLQLVESLMAIGQWQSAENFAQKALAPGSPVAQNPKAMYLLALVHHNKGEHEQAAELLEKLLAKNDNPSARYSLGILYIHYLHNPQKGAEQLRKGLESTDASPSLKNAMADELVKISGAMRQNSDASSQTESKSEENLAFPTQ